MPSQTGEGALITSPATQVVIRSAQYVHYYVRFLGNSSLLTKDTRTADMCNEV